MVLTRSTAKPAKLVFSHSTVDYTYGVRVSVHETIISKSYYNMYQNQLMQYDRLSNITADIFNT